MVLAAVPFGLRLAPSNCKVHLKDWAPVAPSMITHNGEQLKVVGSFIYLDCCLTKDCSMILETCMHIPKTWTTCDEPNYFRSPPVFFKEVENLYVLCRGAISSALRLGVLKIFVSLRFPTVYVLRNIVKERLERHVSSTNVSYLVFSTRSGNCVITYSAQKIPLVEGSFIYGETSPPSRVLFFYPHSSIERYQEISR